MRDKDTKEIEWYFPECFDEASRLLKKEGVIPHGGGTSIRRARLGHLFGLIELSHLPMHYFLVDDGIIEIGATNTFSDVIENIRKIDPEHVLVKSLWQSASTPLRNRITIGGSIAYFPIWSDLMGSLIALDAEVTLIGKNEGIYPITQYVNDRNLRSGALIKSIKFKQNGWSSYYHRESRTNFDYSSFNITILLKTIKTKIEDIRIALVGCTKKYKRLIELEKYFKGKKVTKINVEEILGSIDVTFPAKKLGSPEYISHLVGIQLKRGFEEILNS